MKKDIKYLNVPNVCFSITKKKDKREKEFSKQRIERGFDDSETWNLFVTIARFSTPRLERYIELSEDFIQRTEEDKRQLNKLLEAFRLISKDEDLNIQEQTIVVEGLSYFDKIFMRLWW